MGRLSNEKIAQLLKIEKARFILDQDLQNGVINENDLNQLLKSDCNFGFLERNTKYSYKSKVLKEIFNSPFILCDQNNLSIEVKKVLPAFLLARYSMEIDELNNSYKMGFITPEEYVHDKDMIEFCYYKSSEDGKSIQKNGHVTAIKYRRAR